MTQRGLFDDEEPPSDGGTASGDLFSSLPDGAGLSAEAKSEWLGKVREPALGCTRCALAHARTNVVFGEGNPATPLVFVGEGPGETEDATGRPFVGRAGKLLDEVLAENGMRREHVYICNVLKCRAADREGTRLVNRPPTLEEAAACRPWLEAQLRIIRPLVIVCLGSPAANALIHKNFRITQERGRWFPNNPAAPWIMATLHPAYVLRLHGDAYDTGRRSLSGDVGAAREKVIEVKRAARGVAQPAGSSGLIRSGE